MVNASKVDASLARLREYQARLQELAGADRAIFLKDHTQIGAAKYYLQVAIESCLDIANHIISSERLRAPKTYADAFLVLAERGIFPGDFAKTLVKMTKMRNRLVHLYWEVDDDQVYKTITTDLGDFDTFARYILSYLKNLDSPDQSGQP